MKLKRYFLTLILVIIFIACTTTEEFTVVHQVTGGMDSNCFLVYGEQSREAALIDVAGSIDTLLALIESHQLELKYLLCTHGHFDHLIGVPAIKAKYPDAKIVIHRDEFRDIFTLKEWMAENYGPEFLAYLQSDPELKKLHDFDEASLGEPEIFIEDGQVLKLGHSEIKAIHSPGHSPGSVCYHLDQILFSGDVLFYRTVGRTDLQNSSREDLINSVRRLYELLPDDTVVYPGHGSFTNIGSEKRENSRISEAGGEWIL